MVFFKNIFFLRTNIILVIFFSSPITYIGINKYNLTIYKHLYKFLKTILVV